MLPMDTTNVSLATALGTVRHVGLGVTLVIVSQKAAAVVLSALRVPCGCYQSPKSVKVSFYTHNKIFIILITNCYLYIDIVIN